MRNRAVTQQALALAMASTMAACSGGGSPLIAPTGAVSASPTHNQNQSETIQFSIVVPSAATTATSRRPAYISSATASASFAVNGATPDVIVCTSTCSGSVVAPIGSDTFAVNLYDASNNLLSSGSTTQTIAVGTANSVNLTFNPVVASLSISAASGTAGTAATIPVTVTAKDAAGKTIVGPGSYADANGAPLTITLADSDTSGATTLSTSAITGPGTAVSLTYTGLAIAPATLTAGAGSLSSATSTFTPTLHPIVVTTGDTMNPSFQGIDLYAQSGTGSTGSLDATEIGWTNAPYNKTLTIAVPSTCNTIATFAAGTPPAFNAADVASPTPGTCLPVLSDGAGQSATVTLIFTLYANEGNFTNFAVPAGVSTVFAQVAGAPGGFCAGQPGEGADVSLTLPATDLAATTLSVGQMGESGDGSGAFGGGGGFSVCSGGGASAIISGTTVLAVGAGGGGGGFSVAGGAGGTPAGVAGASAGSATGGGGATQSAGGIGGSAAASGLPGGGPYTSSAPATGGDGAFQGGGGGGGYYAGGGGGFDSPGNYTGGGGGSSYSSIGGAIYSPNTLSDGFITLQF